MPITMGCPSCGKRFKARDESAGKRVKCPYCGVPVTVPSAEEAASAAAPTMTLPPPSHPGTASSVEDSGSVPVSAPRSASSASPPSPAAVATPDDWGAEPLPVHAPKPLLPPVVPVLANDPPAFPMMARTKEPPKKAIKPRMKETIPSRNLDGKTPEQLAAPGWRRVKGGLFWVLFGLFFLSLPGFIGFAKMVLPRAGIEIPKGEGWTIPGYVNSPEPGTVRMKKEEQIDALAYAAPVILAGLAISFGRLTCAAAPRSSGAKGMFAISGLFTFLALVGLVTAGICLKLLFDDTKRQTFTGFLILASAAEFWFLNGLTASGVSLKRPKAARSVGFLGFIFALAALVATAVEMKIYDQQLRPKNPDEDWKLAEQAALMLGWLLLIGVYWRTVGSVRVAIRDFLESVKV